ncbi:hypothetical protein LDO98_07635 [Paenarthrobacter aurescens]|nr:hypothetical protein [Paenarthrobacter aurescens]MDO6143141.1 hypothetical protein [Paenarthrobacter aurescens]MDO6158233.1 hypothetical protein [Paenarthrobacter aurescens]
MSEIHLAFQFRQEMNIPAHRWNRNYRARMQDVADKDDIGIFDNTKNKMPSTTLMLWLSLLTWSPWLSGAKVLLIISSFPAHPTIE